LICVPCNSCFLFALLSTALQSVFSRQLLMVLVIYLTIIRSIGDLEAAEAREQQATGKGQEARGRKS
jgi:hypothetical protein